MLKSIRVISNAYRSFLILYKIIRELRLSSVHFDREGALLRKGTDGDPDVLADQLPAAVRAASCSCDCLLTTSSYVRCSSFPLTSFHVLFDLTSSVDDISAVSAAAQPEMPIWILNFRGKVCKLTVEMPDWQVVPVSNGSACTNDGARPISHNKPVAAPVDVNMPGPRNAADRPLPAPIVHRGEPSAERGARSEQGPKLDGKASKIPSIARKDSVDIPPVQKKPGNQAAASPTDRNVAAQASHARLPQHDGGTRTSLPAGENSGIPMSALGKPSAQPNQGAAAAGPAMAVESGMKYQPAPNQTMQPAPVSYGLRTTSAGHAAADCSKAPVPKAACPAAQHARPAGGAHQSNPKPGPSADVSPPLPVVVSSSRSSCLRQRPNLYTALLALEQERSAVVLERHMEDVELVLDTDACLCVWTEAGLQVKAAYAVTECRAGVSYLMDNCVLNCSMDNSVGHWGCQLA